MENFRFIILARLFLGGILFVTPFFVFAYSDETTHPALTQEIIKLFNQHFPDLKLTNEDGEITIQGSIDEDKGARWFYHFYDPVYDKGLTFGRVWRSSKSWAQDTLAQAKYDPLYEAKSMGGILAPLFGANSDYSWDRAIYEYAWGDKKYGLESLGHVLHLLEDASVPDHTRDDPHPPYFELGSPYESWTKQFDRSNAEIRMEHNEKLVLLSSLESYFDTLAYHSNRNFFSKDTILSKKYIEPIVVYYKHEKLSNNISYRFAYSKNGYRLFRSDIILSWQDIIKNLEDQEFDLKDYDNLILSDYWNLLSKQAVLHGAGVVKLFFDEVEKERQTKVLYEKNRSWLAKQVDKFKVSTFNLASVLYGSSVELEDLNELGEVGPLPQAQPEVQPQEIPGLASPVEAKPAAAPTETATPRGLASSEEAKPLPQPPPPPAPSPNPPKSSNTSDAVPIAGAAGPAPEPEETPLPDTIPPDISLAANECGQSLSSDGCLIATTTATLAWSSTASDFSYYDISCTSGGSSCAGFASGTTTATTTIYTLPTNNSAYTFSAKAVDTTGNESSAATKIVEVYTRPVVINEIAWAGTSASHAQDEWTELYNRTDKTIDLSGWILFSSTDEDPYTQLSGTIPAGGFFLLERTDNNTISDITANQIYTGDLVNSGEVLVLSRASTTMDKTPELSACSNAWCGGQGNPNYYTMERYDPLASGELASNWGTWQSFLANGANAEGAAINGTPTRRNSINYLLTKDAGPLNQDKTLSRANSPYIVSNNFAIGSTATSTLTIEPGVVVKFRDDTSLTVNSGKILAQGTTADQIILTSFKDDTYAGDTNQDGSASSPQAGDWRGVRILADGSIFDRTVIRYGGANVSDYQANLRVENASTTIANSIFEHARNYGAWLKGATTTVSANTFQNNSTTSASIGLLVTDGAVTIQNNTFSANTYGLRMTSAGAAHTMAVLNNTFTQNTSEAVDSNTVYPTFSGNTFSSNGTNGILYQGLISQNYTFSAGSPYKISTGLGVSASTTLTLEAGAVLKFTNSGSLTVQGNLVANGTSANKVVFTSIKDDAYGGDINNDGSATTPAKADWSNVHLENATATSTIVHSVFSYSTTGLKLTNSSATLDNVLFKTNTTGIQALGTSSVETSGITFDSNTTDDNPSTLIP